MIHSVNIDLSRKHEYSHQFAVQDVSIIDKILVKY